MNNEQVVEHILENASERFKTLVTKETGRREGEITVRVIGTPGRRSDFMARMLENSERRLGIARPDFSMRTMRTIDHSADAMKYAYTGMKANRFWIDEFEQYHNPKLKCRKPDWKCSAMERHIPKEETQSKPSKLIKALIGSMALNNPNERGTW
jgi:hypothetical protein